MLPFPKFSLVGKRPDGTRQCLAVDLTPHSRAEKLRAAMRQHPDYAGFESIVVERDDRQAALLRQ